MSNIYRHGNKIYTREYGKLKLFEFGFGFEFSPISKDGVGAGNGNIDTHHEPVPDSAHIY
jgi:hypothetical protein